jgi:hypothetical protein
MGLSTPQASWSNVLNKPTTVSGFGITDVFGAGQSWTNVTATRANNTYYTNSTGKPISVMVSSNLATNVRMQTFIGGTQVADNGISTAYGGMGYTSFIVPNGVAYKINMVHGLIVHWWELRS